MVSPDSMVCRLQRFEISTAQRMILRSILNLFGFVGPCDPDPDWEPGNSCDHGGIDQAIFRRLIECSKCTVFHVAHSILSPPSLRHCAWPSSVKPRKVLYRRDLWWHEWLDLVHRYEFMMLLLVTVRASGESQCYGVNQNDQPISSRTTYHIPFCFLLILPFLGKWWKTSWWRW